MDTRVKDLMTADPITVSPGTTLREVAEKLSADHIGGVPVVTAGRRLVGVVSATDLVDFLASSTGPEPEQGDLTRWEERQAGAEEDDESTPEYFRGGWPPAEGELPELLGEAFVREPDPFEGHTAEEVMTRTLFTIGPDALVGEAASRMLEENVHRLLVVESGELEGVITTRDLIRLLAALPVPTASGNP